MKLKEKREELGLVQADVAKQVGIPQSLLSYIENYKALPIPETMERLVQLFGCSVTDLYEELELYQSIRKVPKRSRINEVYHLTANLPTHARTLLKAALPVCGYSDVTAWINQCYLRLMGEYYAKKEHRTNAGKRGVQCSSQGDTQRVSADSVTEILN